MIVLKIQAYFLCQSEHPRKFTNQNSIEGLPYLLTFNQKEYQKHFTEATLDSHSNAFYVQ